MREQNGTKVPPKPRRSRQTSTQNTTLERPANDDKEAWKAYWKEQSLPWRTEPEIDLERQKYLEKRRSITPDIKQGIYPFGGIKLNRADVEWLLATHENGRGPVAWNDENQREREGLDLRGTDLRNEDLYGLPLAKLRFGISGIESFEIVRIEKPGGNTSTMSVKQVGVYPIVAQLQHTNFDRAQLQGACLDHAQLQGANFFDAKLQEADLNCAELQGANLAGAHLQKACLERTHLEGANLIEAQLQGADLIQAQLQRTKLCAAQLQGADLNYAELQGADLSEAQLQEANLRNVVLADVPHNGPQLSDVQWGDTNLTVVDWSQVTILGDECVAIQEIDRDGGKKKVEGERISEYKAAVRAYRRLSIVLRNQGLNEDAARFAFRAQRMQRKVFWRQRKFGQYLFSGFLNLLAGYGYRFWRIFFVYLVVILTFATTYFVIGHKVGPVLSPLSSVVFSMTSFHGRGFFPGGIGLDDPLTVVAAFEAFIGLLIEVTFIATLTQRLFGK